MPAYFFDSSALVKRYRQEPGTPRVLGLFTGPDRLFISRLTHVEVSAAVVRRGRGTGATAQQQQATLDRLDDDVRYAVEVVDVAAVVVARAIDVTRRHALRGADAIQLATALIVRGGVAPEELILVGTDREMNIAATAEGFQVIDPTRP
jgi:predicted nucleic acid-binding protein